MSGADSTHTTTERPRLAILILTAPLWIPLVVLVEIMLKITGCAEYILDRLTGKP